MIATLGAWLLPPACGACGASLGAVVPTEEHPQEILCNECRRILRALPAEPRCPHCGIAPFHVTPGKTQPGRCSDCDNLPGTFRTAYSVYPYQGPVGFMVRNIKYQRAPYLARWLALLAIAEARPWLEVQARDALLLPMPMYPWREFRRGYNQAELIAQTMGKALGLPLAEEGVLRRVRKGKPQARFHSREERAINLQGAYILKDPAAVRNRRILLVDDVMTTGSTMAAAAEPLMEAGAREVIAFTPVRARLGEDAILSS